MTTGGNVGVPSSSQNQNDGLMLSPRYRNRLTFQAIESDSIVKNQATNRQSTYGINWALKQYEDPQQQTSRMLSPRASNHIAELEKLIDTTVNRKKVEKIVINKNLTDAAVPEMKECQGVCGLDLDRWAEEWPDEWRQGTGQGPVPDAIRSLPDSMQLIDEIERWLLLQSDGSDETTGGAGPPHSPPLSQSIRAGPPHSPPLSQSIRAGPPHSPLSQSIRAGPPHSPPLSQSIRAGPPHSPPLSQSIRAGPPHSPQSQSIRAGPPPPPSHNIIHDDDRDDDLQSHPADPRSTTRFTMTAATSTQTIQQHIPHKAQIAAALSGCRYRLLTSPLLYTPAGFGPLTSQTITLPKPRVHPKKSVAAKPAQRPRSGPIHSDYVVVNSHHVKRRRFRKKKRRSAEADDVVTELSSISDQWSTPPLSRTMTFRRTSIIGSRRSSIASLTESQRGSERRPKARIAHGRLEFLIPESLEESANGNEQAQAESSSKLTALQRYRLKMQHRKKLREDSENFIDELEKQLDKSEIRARFLNPVHEPKFKQHFMQHSQSTIMKSLNGEAQRFLYSESKNKTRHVQIEQRQPRREMHHALQRIDQVRVRQQHHCQMLEQQYQLSLRQFNVNEALSATRERLQKYRRQTEQLQTALDANKLLKTES